MKSTRSEALRAVERYYETGKPCKYGHLAKRFTRSGACTKCMRERAVTEQHTFSRLLREKEMIA